MFDSGLIYIVLAVISAIVVVGVLLGRYKVSSPSEAFVVSGSRSAAAGIKTSSRVVLGGGGVFVVPFVQHLYRISLEQKQISFSVDSAVSENNILVNLTGVASIKIGGDEGSVRAAAQRFLGQQNRIDEYTKEVLEGSLRAIVGSMSVDAINRERAKFASEVAEVAASDLSQQGLLIDTLQIKNVTTDSGYIEDLGRPEAAKVRQEAEVAEARARQTAQEAAASAEVAIAVANRELELKNAEIKEVTDAANAKANAAGPIAEATQRQLILDQERVAAQKKAEVVEKELESSVRKPADARAYDVRVTADAAREAQIAAATANAETVRLSGEADGSAIRARGDAEAAAIKARSDAYRDYPQAGVLDIALEGLPAVMAEAAKPLSAIDTLTVVSTDGMNKLTKDTAALLSQTTTTIKDMTGIDIAGMLAGAAGGVAGALATGTGARPAAATTAEPARAARPAKKAKVRPTVDPGDSDDVGTSD